MTTTRTQRRTRLTPHQTEVHARLTRIYQRIGQPVRADEIGSRGAIAHLMAKGYVEEVGELVGPRGGLTPLYVPLP